jgi:hypothetical protein
MKQVTNLQYPRKNNSALTESVMMPTSSPRPEVQVVELRYSETNGSPISILLSVPKLWFLGSVGGWYSK